MMSPLRPEDETCAPTHWRTMPAINGRGDLLIGPDAYAKGDGACVIAPPGVLLQSHQEGLPPSRDGWRLARWGVDEHGRVLIDQARPKASLEVPLAQVAEEVAIRSPEHLAWIAGIVERQLRLILGRMRSRDDTGARHPGAAVAYDELWPLAHKADEAFAGAATVCELTAPYLRNGYFTDLVRGGYVAAFHGRLDVAAADHGQPPSAPRSTLRTRSRRRGR